MLIDDQSPTSQKSRFLSTTFVTHAMKMLGSLNPQAVNIREPKAVKVATTATNKNVSNCQAFWKIPTRIWRSMNTCSFLTFLANQEKNLSSNKRRWRSPQSTFLFRGSQLSIICLDESNLASDRRAAFFHRDGWLSWKYGHTRYRWCNYWINYHDPLVGLS